MLKKLNSENFEYVAQTEKSLYIIKFGSQTCGPCHTMKPVLDKLAEENPGVSIYDVDTGEAPELAEHFGIRAVPTIHYCENREILYSFHGVTPLRDMQYVINNIDDPHFRETGEFKTEAQKKSYTFEIAVGAALLLFIGAFIAASVFN
jgi:thioredoxin 1